ncbi:MAG: DUF6268 family outer membrane beta-barrel protein [Myxococcota bacterium]
MTLRISILTLLLIASYSSPSHAQGEPPDLGRIDTAFIGNATIRASDEDTSPVTLSTWTSRMRLLVPLPIRRGALLVGANYFHVLALIDQADSPVVRQGVHEVGFALGGVAQIGERWRFAVLAAPSYASDFQGRSRDALNFQAVAKAVVELRPHTLRLAFGLAATNQLGRPAPLPVFELRWVPQPEVTFWIALPRGVRFSWMAKSRWVVAASVLLEGSRYAIGDPDPRIAAADTFRRSVLSAGLSLGVRLAGPLWLEVTGGTTLYRSFELFESSDESLGRADVDNAPMVRLALVVRAAPDTSYREDR